MDERLKKIASGEPKASSVKSLSDDSSSLQQFYHAAIFFLDVKFMKTRIYSTFGWFLYAKVAPLQTQTPIVGGAAKRQHSDGDEEMKKKW